MAKFADTTGIAAVLRFVAWGLGVLALASAFVPLSHGLTSGLSWVLCLYSLLEAGITIGAKRKGAFIVYAAMAVLFNPFVPFHFPPQAWRLLYAGAGVWLVADHLAGVF